MKSPFALDIPAIMGLKPRFQKRGREPRLFVFQFWATTRFVENPQETAEQKPKKTARPQPKAVRKRTSPMFAVIKTGGKQYKVAANDVITIERLEGEVGDVIAFDQVLMLGGETVTVGSPTVAGATVAGELVEQARGPKVISFKKRRRQNSKRKKGHRQHLSLVRITEILTGGAKPSGVKAAKPAVAAAAVGVAAMAAATSAAGGLDESNLSLIAGIGPTIEKKLRAAGITTWSQIAAWGEADVAKWNEELALRGRATREEWVEQAKELLAGKPPRAKADQAELASGKDY